MENLSVLIVDDEPDVCEVLKRYLSKMGIFKQIVCAGTGVEGLNKIQNQEFDLVIVGGGITGAGIARDAISRGMSVALVEASEALHESWNLLPVPFYV